MDYPAIKAEIALPAYAAMTDAQIAAALMAKTVAAPAQKASLEPSRILNACVAADLAALTQLQVLQLSLLLSGATVDVSIGTTLRAGIQNLFAGKATTLGNLAALVAPFDNPPPLPFARGVDETIDAVVIARARAA